MKFPENVDFTAMAIEIHGSNVAAGWYSDLQTGADVRKTRNRPEMLMLAVSELAESAEAADGAEVLMDDKLPNLPMYAVELADFTIRQLDQIGAEITLGANQPDWNFAKADGHRKILRIMTCRERLMVLVCVVSRAMEHYRKGRLDKYVNAMAFGIQVVFLIAEIDHINLLDVMAQKRAYNATRPDHKIENRLQPGGKAF